MIKRTKLYEEIVEEIVEMIKTNNMQAGDKLDSVKDLASRFAVSTTPVREALGALEAGGIIEVKHGSGIFIKDVNEKMTNSITLKLLAEKDNLLNILELRRGLEIEGAFLAAKRATDDDIAKLQNIFVELNEEIMAKGVAANYDLEFHSSIIKATHNPVFINVYDTVTNIFYEGLKSTHEIFSKTLGPRLIILDEHELIFNYIKDKNPEAAQLAMRRHLDNAENRLKGLSKRD